MPTPDDDIRLRALQVRANETARQNQLAAMSPEELNDWAINQHWGAKMVDREPGPNLTYLQEQAAEQFGLNREKHRPFRKTLLDAARERELEDRRNGEPSLPAALHEAIFKSQDRKMSDILFPPQEKPIRTVHFDTAAKPQPWWKWWRR